MINETVHFVSERSAAYPRRPKAAWPSSSRLADPTRPDREANKGSALAETSALRAELASTVQALAKTGAGAGGVADRWVGGSGLEPP